MVLLWVGMGCFNIGVNLVIGIGFMANTSRLYLIYDCLIFLHIMYNYFGLLSWFGWLLDGFTWLGCSRKGLQ